MSAAAHVREWDGPAVPLANRSELGEDAKKLLREELSPRSYIQVLADRKLFHDAVTFLAFALPKSEAVWWACCCARLVGGSSLSGVQAAAVEAAEKWVIAPTEENRRAAMQAAEAAKLATAAGCAAIAAFFSGGSLAPPDVKPVPPPESLTARMVTGAVCSAAVSAEPEKAPEKFRQFLAMGMEIAEGRSLWAPAS
jgi:hypothetical protein